MSLNIKLNTFATQRPLKYTKYFGVLFVLAFYLNCVSAQETFVGMSTEGGKEFGLIFSTNNLGEQQKILHQFDGVSGAFPYYTNLCETNSGKLYGLCSQGGQFNLGVLFEYDTVKNLTRKIIDFNGSGNGSNPRGSLIVSPNGKLYGMCSQGGNNNYGVLFEYNPSTDSFLIKYHFDGNNGRNPFGNLTYHSSGKLYGMTYQGGSSNDGILFEFRLSNDSFYKRHDFDGSNTGRNPFGSLLLSGNGLLYGMTYQGGANNFGVVFSFDPSTNIFDHKIDFDGSNSGSNPYSTFAEGTNGNLYAMAYLGGINNLGTLFEYDISNNTLNKKLDFNGSNNGRNPFGNLTLKSNGIFYAQTPYGGANNAGTIFTYDPNSNSYSKKLDFSSGSSGRLPFGSLFLSSNQTFYGMTYQGGISNSGVLFQYNPNNSSYVKKLDFNSAINGSNPYGDVCLANNLKLYGMTYQGGTKNAGVIFEFDPKKKTYHKKFDLESTSFGKNTYGGFVQANNGKLYGMTYQGGTSDYGTILEYDPINDTCIKRHDFDGNNGRNPYGNLIQANNGKLYGLCPYGGNDDYGVLFEYNTNNHTFSKLLDFDSSTGTNPFGDLIQTSNTSLYGLTYQGGSNDYGVLFEYNLNNNTLARKVDFDGSSKGSYPQGSILKQGNKLYAMTQFGGANNVGVLFEYNTQSNTFRHLFDFNTNNGKSPSGKPNISKNGKIYGLTQVGGNQNNGVLFEYNLSTDTLIKKLDFIGSNGKRPFGSLTPFCLPSFDTMAVSACGQYVSPSKKYTWTVSGNYLDTISSFTSCDSIINIQLRILKSSSFNYTASACDSFIAPNGKRYTSSSNISYIIPNRAGCDSLINIQLEILNSKSNFQVKTCKSYIAPDGKTYNKSGIITAIISNTKGCDSIITVDLTILNTDSTINVVACRVYTAPDGQTYRSSGIKQASIKNSKGCDSLITINLNIQKVETGIAVTDSILSANAIGALYQWLDCKQNYAPIPNANSRFYTATKNGEYAVTVTEKTCTDTSICININGLNIVQNTEPNKVLLYPNPIEQTLSIQLGKQYENIECTLKNLNGQTIQTFKTQGAQTFNFELVCAPGIYIIEIKTESFSAAYKVVKK
jgi:uncharacterized repeat protein (TIGR03803 family)